VTVKGIEEHWAYANIARELSHTIPERIEAWVRIRRIFFSQTDRATAKGNDIFGDGVWVESLLYENLFMKKSILLDRPLEISTEGPVIFAGTAIQNGAQ